MAYFCNNRIDFCASIAERAWHEFNHEKITDDIV